MSAFQLIRVAHEFALDDMGENLEFEDLFPGLDPEDLARLYLAAEAWRKAAGRIAKIVADRWVTVHAEYGSVEVDGYLVYASPSRVDEKCVDTFGFLDWLASNPTAVRTVINPNYVKKGSLPPPVRDTFFEKQRVDRAEVEPVAIPTEYLNDR